MKIRHLTLAACVVSLGGCDLPNTICSSTTDCAEEFVCVTPGSGMEGLCKKESSLSAELLIDLEFGNDGEQFADCLPDSVCDLGLTCVDGTCVEPVEAAPTIENFTLTDTFLVAGAPRPVLPGESVSFSWTTEAATECTLQVPLGQPLAAPTASEAFVVPLEQSGDVVLRCRSAADVAVTASLPVIVDAETIDVSDVGFYNANGDRITSTGIGGTVTISADVDGPASECSFSVVFNGGGPAVTIPQIENGGISITLLDVEEGAYVVDTSCTHIEGTVSGDQATLTVDVPTLEWRPGAETTFQVAALTPVMLDFNAASVDDCIVSLTGSNDPLATFTAPIPVGGVAFEPPVGLNEFQISCGAAVTPLEFTTAVVVFTVPEIGNLGAGFAGGSDAQIAFTVAGSGAALTCDVVVNGNSAGLTAAANGPNWDVAGTVDLSTTEATTDASLDCSFIDGEPAVSIPVVLVRMSAALTLDTDVFLGANIGGNLTVTGVTSCTAIHILDETTEDLTVYPASPSELTVLSFSFASARLNSAVRYECTGIDGSTLTPENPTDADAKPPAPEITGYEKDETATAPFRIVEVTLELPSVVEADRAFVVCGRLDVNGLVDTVSARAPFPTSAVASVSASVPLVAPTPEPDPPLFPRVETVEFACTIAVTLSQGPTTSIDIAVGLDDEAEAWNLSELDDVSIVFGFVDVGATNTSVGPKLALISERLTLDRAEPPNGDPTLLLPALGSVGGLLVTALSAEQCAVVDSVLDDVGMTLADLPEPPNAYLCD